MKKTKSKGFTLIELMVVISIIALLSSVVLASVNSGREKAVLIKTVGEMKSLQNALELHRTSKGNYPLVDYGTSDDDDDVLAMADGFTNFDQFIKTNLVNNKYLTKVPHAPKYPNCFDMVECLASGYVLGYRPNTPVYSSNFLCGGQTIKNYYIFFMANSKKVNLPLLSASNGTNVLTSGSLSAPPYVYCLSM